MCLSVSLFLFPPPLAFPLIFNKQQLGLSATGRQFVPTNKKPWQQPLEGPVRFQKMSALSGCSGSLWSLSPFFFFFFLQIWLKWEIGINKQMSSLKVGDRSFFFFLIKRRLKLRMISGLRSLLAHLWLREATVARTHTHTHTHTHNSALVEQWERGNLIKVRGEGRESEAAVCQDAYTVLSGLPLLTIRTSLLLMIQLCLHPSLLPPTPTSCF